MNNDYLRKAEAVIPDKKILSVVASKRARQLALGGRPMVKCDDKSFVDIALLEIGMGLLDFTQSEFGMEAGMLPTEDKPEE